MQDYILGQDLKQDHRFLSTYYYKRFDRELNVPFPKYVVAWRITCNLKSIPCRLYCRTGKKESLKCLLTRKITFEYKIWNKTIDFLLEREPNVPFPKCLQRHQELRRNHWWDWGVKWTVIVKTERDAVRTYHLGPPKIRQASRLYSDRLESNFTLPSFEDACFKFGFLQGNPKYVKRNLVFWWSLKTDTPRRLDGIEFTGLKARTVAVPTQRLTSAELMK